MITPINPTVELVDVTGRPLLEFRNFLFQLANESLIVGSGSPEGVVEAAQGREYMDEDGTTGSIKYIKKQSDISGDRTQGWILI